MTVVMFPGQGAQTKGMGEALFKAYPDYVNQANELLGYDIEALCLHDAEEKLNQTEFTQPALYIVSCLAYMQYQEEYLKPSYVLGHSLGEYNALFAAGCFDFLTGLKLVKKRGELMGQATGGGMLALLGLDIKTVQSILADEALNTIDIANHNTPKQIVISGLKHDIEKAKHVFSDKAKRCIPLNVSGAFHSRYVLDAQKQFSSFIESIGFSKPTIPVVANVTAQPYEASHIIDNLVNQITGQVRWVESIEYLLALGEKDFQHVGPGNVLNGMFRQISAVNQ